MIENGKKVKIHYAGTLDDGHSFDSSMGRDPLEFEMGAGQVISGFETGVREMKVGEKKIIHIPATEAYGERHDEMEMEVDRAQLPEQIEPKVGMQLHMEGPQEQTIPVQITSVAGPMITLDANHPLAGKNLNFELELLAVSD